MTRDPAEIAGRLLHAFETATTLDPITTEDPDFDVAAAYEVLARIEHEREALGWQRRGRKIGFTNRTIWERYGVSLPMWASVWDRTVHFAPGCRASMSLAPFVQPRIEPEIAFRLRAPLGPTADALEVLAASEWIAPTFEIVQSHFPGWRFAAPDCTAAFGLHGALIVGPPLMLTDSNRATIAGELPAVEVALARDGEIVDRGVGANVLDSPALALAHLTRVLATQPDAPPLRAGEIVTTGTITDAAPVAPGETWSSDYGAFALSGLTLTCV